MASHGLRRDVGIEGGENFGMPATAIKTGELYAEQEKEGWSLTTLGKDGILAE